LIKKSFMMLSTKRNASGGRWLMSLFVLPVIFLCNASNAEVSVASIFNSNMVLQRDMPIHLWGWANQNEKVIVDFNGQKVSALPGRNGRWEVTLLPMKVSHEPLDLRISGENTITLNNILIGEVWICSGQSNMDLEMALCLNATQECEEADYPEIRLMKVTGIASHSPRENIVGGQWVVCSPESANVFSGAAYYFGRELFVELGVPIGLIASAYGGSRIQAWIPKNDFNRAEKAGEALEPPAEVATAATPCAFFNGMIAPLVPYGVRGVIWYQGESNFEGGMDYFHLQRTLIERWRKAWGKNNLSFYYVQLPNYSFSNEAMPEMGDGWASIREGQSKCLEIPNTGMVTTLDIGEATDLHPGNKQDVGKRLARWALAKDYGKSIVYSGPRYKASVVKGNEVEVSFDHVGLGLMIGEKNGLEPVKEVVEGQLKWLSLCDGAGKWHWAEAVVEGNTLRVWSEFVDNPTAIRYAYTQNPQGLHLYNKEGLPAGPFRDDAILAQLDMQESEFLCRPLVAEVVRDDQASDGEAVRIKSTKTLEWGVKQSLNGIVKRIEFKPDETYTLYMRARCEVKSKRGIAFQSEVLGAKELSGALGSVTCQDIQDNAYRNYELGTTRLSGGMAIWITVWNNPDVKALWIDKFWVERCSPQSRN